MTNFTIFISHEQNIVIGDYLKMIQGTILVIYPTLLGFGYLKNSPSLPSNNQRSRGARFAWVHKNCVKSDYGVLKVNDADRHEPYSLVENIVAYIIALE